MPQDNKLLRPKPQAGDGPDSDPPVQLRTESGNYITTEDGTYITTE